MHSLAIKRLGACSLSHGKGNTNPKDSCNHFIANLSLDDDFNSYCSTDCTNNNCICIWIKIYITTNNNTNNGKAAIMNSKEKIFDLSMNIIIGQGEIDGLQSTGLS